MMRTSFTRSYLNEFSAVWGPLTLGPGANYKQGGAIGGTGLSTNWNIIVPIFSTKSHVVESWWGICTLMGGVVTAKWGGGGGGEGREGGGQYLRLNGSYS